MIDKNKLYCNWPPQFLIFRKLYILQFKETAQKVLEKYQLDLGVIYFILKGSGDKGKSKHMRHQTHSKTMQQLSRHGQPIDWK
jgi:hypothetical protein